MHPVEDCDDGLLGCSDSPVDIPVEGPAELSYCPTVCPADELSVVCLLPVAGCSECSVDGPAGADRIIRPTRT